ncbi:hypothetical protein L798_10648 [Zootermopsis nevadensis]|uniref:Uncharacterized protein n=1 Tax=Zootermopsis nevadensis TaxID=136037 RepID=A0A067R919_ZOONE|nr:hypothetical protein L798_10648 [Zootermopsis nevadensis]
MAAIIGVRSPPLRKKIRSKTLFNSHIASQENKMSRFSEANNKVCRIILFLACANRMRHPLRTKTITLMKMLTKTQRKKMGKVFWWRRKIYEQTLNHITTTSYETLTFYVPCYLH